MRICKGSPFVSLVRLSSPPKGPGSTTEQAPEVPDILTKGPSPPAKEDIVISPSLTTTTPATIHSADENGKMKGNFLNSVWI